MQSQQGRPFGQRSISASGGVSRTEVTRVTLGPIHLMNRQSNAADHLHSKSKKIIDYLARIEGMDPYLKVAYTQAETCAEQQALSLSQPQTDLRRMSSATQSIHSDVSSVSSSPSSSRLQLTNIFTFVAGVLPATVGADPVTHLWKLFQLGAPLCLLYNHIAMVSKLELTKLDPTKFESLSTLSSNDLRAGKGAVYQFLIAVQTTLNFPDELMITISDVFLDSTHDFWKVIKLVDRVIALDSEPQLEISRLLIDELTDERSKVFNELISTERKYVQDLELMLQYKNDLQRAELLSNEQIDTLFPNLNAILDFQRRFLNGLESNISVQIKYQRIGSIFAHAANGPFRAYEPWTMHQLSAIDLIGKESSNLKKSSNLLDPGFELQSYIIKPIQRLCKYPLLTLELIKATPDLNEENVSNELVAAHIAMKDVAGQVNEAQRRSENIRHAQNLQDRVNNWRGFSVLDQGNLLLYGVVGVRDSESEKDYIAYLFEKIMFFFVDTGLKEKEKKRLDILSTRKKSTSLVASQSTTSLVESLSKLKDQSHLELKGRVYVREIYNITSSNSNGYFLQMAWSGKRENGSFTLRYRNEETRNQWESQLKNLKAGELSSSLPYRKVRDSLGSQDHFYEVFSTFSSGHDNASVRSSNGSNYQRHHSSLSTLSMLRMSKSKSTNGERPSSIEGNIAIKLLYNQLEIPDKLVVSSGINFNDLRLKILSKVASSSSVKDDIMISKFRYKDEDGDFVVMDTHEDWLLAIEMLDEDKNHTKGLTIWVS